MAKSILQKHKRCIVCHTVLDLHRHHVFEGANRELSEADGLTVYLCAKHHDMSDEGIHTDKALDRRVKALAQRKAMKYYGWSQKEWIQRYGRSWYNGET